MTWEPGQRVVEISYTPMGERREIMTVERVTPSGRALVGFMYYLPDGRVLGGSGRYRIAPVTQADEEEDVRRKLQEAVMRRVTKAMDRPWTLDELAVLDGILDAVMGRART